jgi:hypothetical protein
MSLAHFVVASLVCFRAVFLIQLGRPDDHRDAFELHPNS